MEKFHLIFSCLQLSKQLSGELEKKNYPLARDYSLQIYSLLNILTLLSKENNVQTKIFQRSVNGIKIISEQLASLQESLQSTAFKLSLTLPSSPPPSLLTSGCCNDQRSLSETKNQQNNPNETLRDINFTNIIGSDDAKQVLYENVILPLSLSNEARLQIFNGIRSSVGNVLLFGPPGTGKTCLVQAAASESSAVLFSIRPSEVLSKYQGESERYISQLFINADKQKKSIIFFDEFDSLATSRGLGEDSTHNRRLLAELLLQLTIHKQQDQKRTVVVIAATNRLEDLDEAILRRFDCKIFVGPPNHEHRIKLIHHFMKDINHTLNEEALFDISTGTEGWSGAEIQSLCREAAMIPLREVFPCLSRQTDLQEITSLRHVNPTDFDLALESLMNPHLALLSENHVENTSA